MRSPAEVCEGSLNGVHAAAGQGGEGKVGRRRAAPSHPTERGGCSRPLIGAACGSLTAAAGAGARRVSDRGAALPTLKHRAVLPSSAPCHVAERGARGI